MDVKLEQNIGVSPQLASGPEGSTARKEYRDNEIGDTAKWG
jgi:hypothetical protein